jgi:hypothetical protein
LNTGAGDASSASALPSSAGSSSVPPLAEHWRAIAPATFDAARGAVTRRMGTWMWDPMILSVLRLPGWLAVGGLGLALSYAGRRRRTVNVFAN